MTTTSTATDSITTPPAASAAAGPDGRVTVRRVVHAELIKLRTVRSTVAAALLAALSIVAMGAFAAIGIVVAKPPDGGAADVATTDPAGGALTGVSIAVYAVAALGVLTVTSEYATGTIKPALAAVPRRGLLVAGKAIALAGVTFAVTLAATVTAFVAAKAVLGTAGMTVSLTEPGVPRAVVGAALYLTVVAVLGSAFGWLLRSTAGAIATLLAVLVLPPVIGLLLPAKIAAIVVPYLPDNAGTAITQLTPSGQLGPWTGFAVFLGYAAVALAGSVLAVRHRDA